MSSIKTQYRLRPQQTFQRHEREHTTVLSGGLTRAHERLVEAGLRALGYRSVVLPSTDLDAYALGREHCSNGLCNPAYFTIGNLLKYLRRLRDDEGMSVEQICRSHVFYTAGSYGPCRFGMYESEYRFALESAGFADFRVIVFQQSRGLVQSGSDSGLDLNADFFLAHVKAFLLGDIVNELYHTLKPYELQPGAADRARDEAVQRLLPHMAPPPPSQARRLVERLTRDPRWAHQPWQRQARKLQSLLLVADQLRDLGLEGQLAHAVAPLQQVEVDWLRLKPVVKITGEFWAQTTETDGNFRMFEFLEKEGAEIIAEPLLTWLDYLLHLARERQRDLAGLPAEGVRGPLRRAVSRLTSHAVVPLNRAMLRGVSALFSREYDRLRGVVGGGVLPLVDQDELIELARPFYDPRLHGGEGHLEIGKTIHYSRDRLAHMVVSLKPFGCMPSTQSDGAQPAVLAANPDILFLPVETSSDGEGPALSRVQMMLAEARARARAEWQQLLQAIPYRLDDLRAYLAEHPELSRGGQALSRDHHDTARAVRFARWLAQRMQAEGWQAPLAQVVEVTRHAGAEELQAGGAA